MNTKIRTKLVISFVTIIIAIITIPLAAQIPTLTNDDILSNQPSEKIKPESQTTKLTEKNEANEKGIKSVEKKASNPAEDGWNEKYAKALELTKKLHQEADQTELEIVRLRNQMQSVSGKQPDEYNNLNQQISALSEKSKKLKKEAIESENELSLLNNEGKKQEFKLKEQSFKNEQGVIDQGAIETATLQIQQEIQNEEAHIELMKIEVNRLHSESVRKSNADKFALNRIVEARSQAELEIQNSIKKISELKEKQTTIKKTTSSIPAQ
jgi:hypothetical protein